MIEGWRRLGTYLLLAGIAGVFLELLLLEHFEDLEQWAPLALLGAGLVLGAAVALRPTRTLVHALRALMVAYLVAAGAGIFFHLRSNVEFELELRPSLEGIELVMETLKGAMPALAPGAMAQLGLLGLLVLHRHPMTATGVAERDARPEEIEE